MNIAEILEKAPKGTKLYSPVFGECELEAVYLNSCYPIMVTTKQSTYRFTSEGLLYNNERNGECMLFPSRDNRDWNTFKKFDINTLKPFDRVLVRDSDKGLWHIDFYSHYKKEAYYKYECSSACYGQCIPYNDETKHLVGTDKDCPDYYRTW